MKSDPSNMPAEGLRCQGCGYDLRSHGNDTVCPECGMSVAGSRELAQIPVRPVWHRSDPRWRGQMVAGAWVLSCLPLMPLLHDFGLASQIPVFLLFRTKGANYSLDDTLLAGTTWVYQPLVLFIGLALIFYPERDRRRSRLDWTRRWGMICCCITVIIQAAAVLFIMSLVGVGISALFFSMPLRYQPSLAGPLVNVSAAYLRHGPQPSDSAPLVAVASTSFAILFACIPLYNALGSIIRRFWAAIVLAPLAVSSVWNLILLGAYVLAPSTFSRSEITGGALFFRSDVFADGIRGFLIAATLGGQSTGVFCVETIKWCVVFGIACCLTAAQLRAWLVYRRQSDSSAAQCTPDPKTELSQHSRHRRAAD